MSREREIKSGKISVSKTSFLKAKTWMIRCCTLYDKTAHSPAKLLMTDESNSGVEPKTFLLENVCVINKRVSKSKMLKVEIHWRREKFSFVVDSEHEANSWIDHLNEVAHFDHKISKKISAENLSTSSSVSENDAEIFVTNTDYQSLDMWTYDVEMSDTEASLRCQLSGPYRLQLTKQGFFLLTVKERRVLYQWPYHFIRRYGKSQSTFTIQAGRKCESGEGGFCFGTKPGESFEIFQKVNQLTLQLKASQNELAAENSPAPWGAAKPNWNAEPKKTLLSPTVEINQSPLLDSKSKPKISLPFQRELQHKLATHSDKYSNVNPSSLPSPPVVKSQHLYSDLITVPVKTPPVPSSPNQDYDDYSLIEVNNNHGSRNVQNQPPEDNYDRLEFDMIESPLPEKEKKYKPYIYDSVMIQSQQENVYEEAVPFTSERNACGGKLPAVPVVITQKPFMEPATLDDGYR